MKSMTTGANKVLRGEEGGNGGKMFTIDPDNDGVKRPWLYRVRYHTRCEGSLLPKLSIWSTNSKHMVYLWKGGWVPILIFYPLY
ncbi:hypothetical protein ACSQ67_006017 [Phaseolus vulgaris]